MIYDVACYHKGRFLWSVSQEALTPAHALAQAVLPGADRAAFVWEHPKLKINLEIPHPLDDAFILKVTSCD